MRIVTYSQSNLKVDKYIGKKKRNRNLLDCIILLSIITN